MPTGHITVTVVSDEGDTVIVWGQPVQTPRVSEPAGYAFQTRGGHDTVALSERASRLASGTEVAIEYTAVTEGWNLGSGLASS